MVTLARQIQDSVYQVFESNKIFATCAVSKTFDKEPYRVKITTRSPGRLIGRKGCRLQILSDIIEAKFKIRPNIHVVRRDGKQKRIEMLLRRNEILAHIAEGVPL